MTEWTSDIRIAKAFAVQSSLIGYRQHTEQTDSIVRLPHAYCNAAAAAAAADAVTQIDIQTTERTFVQRKRSPLCVPVRISLTMSLVLCVVVMPYL